LKLPIIIIVWVDNEFGLISLKQKMEFGQSGFTEFNNPDFVMLAKSFGARGYKVNSVDEFQSTLIEATHSIDTPVIIAVDVDVSRNTILLNDEYCNLPGQ